MLWILLHASNALAIGSKGRGSALPGQAAAGQFGAGTPAHGPVPLPQKRRAEPGWGLWPQPRGWRTSKTKLGVRLGKAWAELQRSSGRDQGRGLELKCSSSPWRCPCPDKVFCSLFSHSSAPELRQGYSTVPCGIGLGHTSQNPFGTLSENHNILYILEGTFSWVFFKKKQWSGTIVRVFGDHERYFSFCFFLNWGGDFCCAFCLVFRRGF